MTDRRTVFLVDDDGSVRRALARLLRSAGYRVEAFASGQEFLSGIGSASGAACIVLDLQMPGLDGLELQNELRTRAIELPIVFVTGQGDIPSSVQAMKAGAVDFLTKPVMDDDLLRAVELALARDELERERRAELDSVLRGPPRSRHANAK